MPGAGMFTLPFLYWNNDKSACLIILNDNSTRQVRNSNAFLLTLLFRACTGTYSSYTPSMPQ